MNVNILLFEDFELLDAFGPAEIFGYVEECQLKHVSLHGGAIKSRQGTVVLTEPLEQADYSGTLLLPGGLGTRPLVKNPRFIESLARLADQSSYCLTVCTGSGLLAQTGLLDGKKATSNKRAFDWARSVSSKVEWIGRARWVVDGKFYTSSGVSAGMDMTLGFVADQFGQEKAEEIASRIEYLWNRDKNNDPFAR